MATSAWKPVNEDATSAWKPVAESPAAPPQQSFMSQAGDAAKNLGIGVAKSAGGLMSSADDFARQHLPSFMTNTGMGFGKPENIPAVHQMMQPHGTAQEVGKGLGDAAQFAIPIGGPEGAIGRLGMEAARGGLVNKSQGGSFGAGAAMGGAGEGIAQGMKAMAPGLAESALNIRKTDRAYKPSQAIGKTILNDTTGVRPGTVAGSAQGTLSRLNPQLDQAAMAADVRPTQPVRGLLQAPQYEVSLSGSQASNSTRGGLFDAAENPHSPTAKFGDYTPNAHYLSGGEHPELSGKTTPAKGVMLTRDPDIARANGANIPSPGQPIPYAGASLSPAKSVLGQAAGKATQQNEPTTFRQLQPMMEHLTQNRITGSPIDNTVSASQLLNLKRGFGNEFIHNWNPETMTGVKGTAGQTYHQLGQEFNRVVPEAEGLNSRISNLIPVAKRGSSAELNAPTSQRIAGRVMAHTGALAGAAMGGTAGYQHSGPMGALVGGAAGLALPEMMGSPTGQMIAARTLNGKVAPGLVKAAGGGLLKAARGNSKDEEEK